MASTTDNAAGTPLLLVGDTGGVTIVSPSTPLRRLNYFDGKFLRADDFTVEQSYLRQLVALSNQGLGPGVVYGYDTTLAAGDAIQVGPGLAIDPAGKVLLLQSTITQSVQALIDATRKRAVQAPDASGKIGGFSDCIEVAPPPPPTVVQTSDMYVIAICAAEALCGQEDVYGVACQETCVTASDRPYRLDGIVLRAIPLQLVTPLPTSKAVNIDADRYLRAKVAHRWFADEQLRHPSAISRAGLLTQVWCLGAGYSFDCCEVPLAVVARSGGSTLFLDAWTVRRERIDAPAKRYWQWKMRMRPWDVFLAQVLQFQCQLADLLAGVVVPGGRGGDPCADAHQAIGEAAKFVEQVRAGLASYRDTRTAATGNAQPPLLALSLTHISDLGTRLKTVLQSAATPAQPAGRVLIWGGIIDMPPAGYLPVISGSSISVNAQVRALLGEGLDLRFCITSADYIAHVIEEAQHMDRISLLQGLDDPNHKPRVDILVPDGQGAAGSVAPATGLFAATFTGSAREFGGMVYQGAARETTGDAGGMALGVAGAGLSQNVVPRLQDNKAPAPVQPASEFVKATGKLGTDSDMRVASEAMLARGYISAFQAGTTAPITPRAPTQDSVDGFWIDVALDKQIRTLAAGEQTPVHLRIVLASKGDAPVATDFGFHGTLLIGNVAATTAGLAVTGTVTGVLALGQLRMDPAQPNKVTADVVTQGYKLPITLLYSGDASTGKVQVDLKLSENADAPVLRLIRSTLGAAQATYQLVQLTKTTAAVVPGTMLLAELQLAANADVANANDVYHQYADQGLDLLQAALVGREPGLKSSIEARLFPAPPAAGTELVIQAVLDWVAFTKRREQQCQPGLPPPPAVPPRRYRVLCYRAEAEQAATAFMEYFRVEANRRDAIQFLLNEDRKNKHAPLVVKFAGGSATPESDMTAAELDWKKFDPGDQIYYSAAGALGESDPNLQLERLHTFLRAIADDSKEVKGAPEDAIIPWPEVVQDDADGFIVVVTVTKPAETEAIQVYGANEDGFAGLSRTVRDNSLTADQWQAAVAQFGVIDLGVAVFTVGAPDSVDVRTVPQKFADRFPQQTISESLLISGDSTGRNSDRLSAAQKLVKEITNAGFGPNDVQVHPGPWFAVTPSVLLLRCSFLIT